VAKPPISEEPRQHGKSACRQGQVDEWFLPFQCFDGRATGQRIFAGSGVDNLGVELTDEAKPVRFAPVPCVQWLPGTYCPLDALFPRSSQYATRLNVFVSASAITKPELLGRTR
jgi:hypothetical protein